MHLLIRQENSLLEEQVNDPCMTVRFALEHPEYLFTYNVVPCKSDEGYLLCQAQVCPKNLMDTMVMESEGELRDTHDLVNTAIGGHAFIIPGFDIQKSSFLAEARESTMNYSTQGVIKMFNKFFKGTNGESESLQELLWFSDNPCFDMLVTSKFEGETGLLKKCLWKNVDIPCHKLFVKVPTDKGMCCAFNIDQNAETAYKNYGYTSFIKKWRNKDIEQSFKTNWTGVVPDMLSQPGIENGLTIFLDAHTDKLEQASIKSDYYGFLVHIGAKDEYPWVKNRGFIIEPGKETHVQLDAVRISANEIRSISPEDRQCYFSDEKELEGHNKYTLANCLYECKYHKALENISKTYPEEEECAPWFLIPLAKNVSRCDPWKALQFTDVMRKVNPTLECLDCLADCETTKYQYFSTSSFFG